MNVKLCWNAISDFHNKNGAVTPEILHRMKKNPSKPNYKNTSLQKIKETELKVISLLLLIRKYCSFWLYDTLFFQWEYYLIPKKKSIFDAMTVTPALNDM